MLCGRDGEKQGCAVERAHSCPGRRTSLGSVCQTEHLQLNSGDQAAQFGARILFIPHCRMPSAAGLESFCLSQEGRFETKLWVSTRSSVRVSDSPRNIQMLSRCSGRRESGQRGSCRVSEGWALFLPTCPRHQAFPSLRFQEVASGLWGCDVCHCWGRRGSARLGG